MPPDITGPGAVGGVPIPPSAPVRPVAPSRALVPVERVGPRLPPADSPLGRSGVALEDLLFAPDVLKTREAVAPVALEVGLETARRQLLQRQPTDALASLDAIWGRAATSEEGWYLRSGALTVLGHPLEGDRVAEEGLEMQPQSLALRLLQSVARAVVGDLSGARAVLHPALDDAPGDPVLRSQQAVILARQGHREDAAELLAQLTQDVPDHPALAWAKAAVRSASTDRTRSAARPAFEEASASAIDAAAAPAGESADGDMVSTALRQLGASIRNHDEVTLQQEARTLLRACSAGGTLASACTAQEAHAARQVLTALLSSLKATTAFNVFPSPLTSLLKQLVPLLRAPVVGNANPADTARYAEAERLLRRQGSGVPPAVRGFLDVMLRGAGAADVSSERGDAQGIVLEEPDLGPLLPVRLGLALLTETSATRAFARSQEVVAGDRPPSPAFGPDSAAGQPPIRDDAGRGPGAALPAIALVAGALGAAVNGAGMVALVLGGGALWFVLRRPRN